MALNILLCLPGFFLTLLLFAAVCHCAEDVSARTIEVSQQQCGKIFEIGKTDTGRIDVYRLILPEGEMCSPESSFVCSVFFQFRKLADTYFREKLKEVCVDFARMRLYGDKTKVYISNGDGFSPTTVLNASRYPLIHEYLDTVKCYSSEMLVNVTFSAPCTLPFGSTLRDYFSSWIYVYFKTHGTYIFHVDGTCRHREGMSSSTKMTLRSFIWKDTAQKEESQNCSLEIRNYSSFYIIHTVKLCFEWDFHYTPCGVSVSLHHKQTSLTSDRFDDSQSASFSCNTGGWKFSDYKKMDKCIAIDHLKSPFIEVKRTIAPAGTKFLQDGLLFFKAQLRLRKETNYDSHEDDVPDSEPFSDGLWKLFLPVFVVAGIFAVVCSLRRKKKRREQSDETDSGTDNARQAPAQETQVSERLVPPVTRAAYQPCSSGSSRPRRSSDGAGGDRSAPPPAYCDVTSMTPSNRRHSSDEEVQSSALALEGSDPDVPPPSSTSQPSVAPPAYHELFPCDT